MVVVEMSRMANIMFGFAKSIANTAGSGMAIRIGKNGNIETKFVSKKGSDSHIWENHYDGVAFYLGDSANPVRWDFKTENKGDETIVDALENSISTKRYKTFMQTQALSKIFNISGPQQDKIITLLYANIGVMIVVGMLVLAVYGSL